jgi:hypothetical protein
MWAATRAWVALYALWWLFVGSWSPWSAVWGAGLAFVATAGAVVSRREGPGHLPAAGALLAGALAHGDRGPHGRFVVRDTDAAGRDAVALRAWKALLSSYSPNAWVADIDGETGRALLHDLVVRRDSEAPV